MPQTPKLSPQQKLIIVEKILAGETSRQAAAKSVGVSNTTVRQWLRIYEAEGPGGLTPREKSRHLTAEEKQAAVADYLAGEGSLFEICKKYGIRSPQNLEKMVETAKQGGALRGYHGASRHRGDAYTTAADRVQIVQDCLANGCDYGATALKYNVDYKALVNWVGRYRAHGPAALHDSRHSSEGTRRAKGRVRAVAPMQRLVIVLDCLENRKNYGAMAQKYAVAYHQVYRWVQRYLQDGWLGMNDRRGPADDPGPEGEWARVAPASEDAAEKWVARCAGVPDALPALLRRAGRTEEKAAGNSLTIGTITLDLDARNAYKNGQLADLTAKEFDVIEFLMRNPNRVYSREALLDTIWAYEYRSDIRTVDVRIANLRKKLNLSDEIQSVYKIGYRFKADDL